MQTGIQLEARAHRNPILGFHEYKVEIADSATDVFTANFIAETMYSQVLDGDGHSYLLMSNEARSSLTMRVMAWLL